MLKLNIHRPGSFAPVYASMLGVLHCWSAHALIMAGSKFISFQEDRPLLFVPMVMSVTMGVASLGFWGLGYWFLIKGSKPVNKIAFTVSVLVAFAVVYSFFTILGYWLGMLRAY